MKEELLRIYCDFDGTITEKEICLKMFEHYCDNYQEVLEKFRSERLQIKDIWRLLTAAIPPNISWQELEDFCGQYEPLPYFKEMYEFVKSKGIPFKIISDGFDIYIRRILKNVGLEEIESKSNLLVRKNNRWGVEFPGASESCPCNAGSCKRNAIINDAKTDSVIVYIGDGISDFCAVRHADIIFAKKNLALYCSREKLPFYPFKSFYDIQYRLESIIKTGKIKQRNQAFVNRKKAFEIE